ncbi:MAG: putative glycosyltransferase [Microgenomates bacterium 39_7]|nr:MAG: putative glycosyltransferase [Microgenomates bacterium 39_7]
MSNSASLISIIVVNYDTTDLSLDCLNSLSKIECQDFNYNVVVVDNGSQKEFKLPVKLRKDNIEVIRTDNNIGFTGGNNLGITYAAGHYNPDYFLLLNSDTTVTPLFLHELLLSIQGDDRGIAVSKILFEKGYEFYKDNYDAKYHGNVVWFAGGTIDWPYLRAFHRGVDEVDRGQFDHLTNTDFATGCCMLIKREVVEEVGLLDKKYFLYLEDVDYSIRAKKRGYKIVFSPRSVIYHKNAGSSGGAGSKLHGYYQTRNRALFFFRYAKIRYKLTLLKLMFQDLFKGDEIQRQAVVDSVLGRYGKQPFI